MTEPIYEDPIYKHPTNGYVVTNSTTDSDKFLKLYKKPTKMGSKLPYLQTDRADTTEITPLAQDILFCMFGDENSKRAVSILTRPGAICCDPVIIGVYLHLQKIGRSFSTGNNIALNVIDALCPDAQTILAADMTDDFANMMTGRVILYREYTVEDFLLKLDRQFLKWLATNVRGKYSKDTHFAVICNTSFDRVRLTEAQSRLVASFVQNLCPCDARMICTGRELPCGLRDDPILARLIVLYNKYASTNSLIKYEVVPVKMKYRDTYSIKYNCREVQEKIKYNRDGCYH